MKQMPSSLLTDPYREIALPRAPLVLVLTQARIPHTPELADRSTLERIHRRLRVDFPVPRWPSVASTKDDSVAQASDAMQLRMETIDKEWFATVGPESIALSTTAYSSRVDFVDRARKVLDAVAVEAAVPACDRLGVRYVDRVTDAAVLADLAKYVLPALLGIVELPVRDGVEAVHSLSDSLLKTGAQTRLRIRSGVLPPEAVMDVSIAPVQQPSWVLDIDSYREETIPFTAELADHISNLAEDAYQLFRWGVTESFITHFGGELQ